MIQCLGNISCLIQAAPYQYSPPRTGLAYPAFMNGSNQSGGGLAASNCGAYGLRYFWQNLSPFDDAGQLVQFAGGSISGRGVRNWGRYLSNLEEYHALSSANTGSYLWADDPTGEVLFDGGNSQISGPFPVWRINWPVNIAADSQTSIGSPTINNGLNPTFSVNFAGHVNKFDLRTGTWKTYTRHPQGTGEPDYSYLLYWETDPYSIYQGNPARYEASNWFGIFKQILGVFNLSGGLGNVGWSIQNSKGTGFFWDENTSMLRYVPGTDFPVEKYNLWNPEEIAQPVEFSVSTDNDAAQINNNIIGAIVPGGNYLVSPKTIQPRYLLVLSDLSGYYGINFHGSDTASENALNQVGGYANGFGMDLSGNFWFQDGNAVLYSSLGLDSFKVFNGGNYSPLPFINFQAMDCRRLLAGSNTAWEG